MQERDVLDAILVAVLAVVAYLRTFGIADPVTTLEEILAILLGIDVQIYLVLAGVLGIVFVGYITIYLPKKNTRQIARER